MRRATIRLPDDLTQAVDDYVRGQKVPPALATVMQAALREYLQKRGFLSEFRPLNIAPRGNSGHSDGSQNYDLYVTGVKK